MMAKFKIVDLAFCENLDNHSTNVAGGASAGAAAAANYEDTLASAASTSDGYVDASAYGSFRDSYGDRYGYSSYSGGPSVNVSASDRYYYYW